MPRIARGLVRVAAHREHVHVASVREEAPPAESRQQASASEAFDWRRQWYGLAIAADLVPGRPHAVELLGQPLVLWRDGEGEWRAFEDRCPHRLAPLSEGRVEGDGTLLCSYHGWRFDSEGNCTTIPQANETKIEETACASSRSCVKSYPVQIRDNMLWVWGESGPDAFIHAAAKEPAVTAELEALSPDTHIFRLGKPYTRDLHYDYTTLVENFVDPAHVPFAHHTVLGNRYRPEAGFTQIQRSAPEHNVPDGGFSFDVTLKSFGTSTNQTRIQFQPPGRVRYFTPRDDGTFSCMNLHCVPTGPNRSRVTYEMFSTNENKFTKMGEKIPGFLDHQQRNLVFDGDHALLHIQERIAEREAAQPGGSWRKSYYMPTESDRIVTAWRQWLDRQGTPEWAPGAAPAPTQPLPKAVLLDRYEQHTKHCPTCMKALSNFKLARVAAAALSIAAAVASLSAALSRPVASQWQLPAALAVAAVALAFAWRYANKWVHKFGYVPYDHQAKE